MTLKSAVEILNNKDHDAPGASLEISRQISINPNPKEIREAIWPVFHKLWSRDVGTPGYNKERWRMLEQALLRLSDLATQTQRPILISSETLRQIEKSSCQGRH